MLSDVWNLVRFLVGYPHDSNTWCALFDESLLDLMHLPQRGGFPLPDFQAIWVTGDAVVGRSASTNWATGEYIVEDVLEFLEDIIPDGRSIIIRDSEQFAPTGIIAT